MGASDHPMSERRRSGFSDVGDGGASVRDVRDGRDARDVGDVGDVLDVRDVRDMHDTRLDSQTGQTGHAARAPALTAAPSADRPRLVLTSGLAGALLAACGGGNGAGAPPPAEFMALDSARHGAHILSAGAAMDGGDLVPLPSARELLDWAELAYPQFFPGHSPDQLLEPYQYRYYAGSANYLGVAGSDIYLLGPDSGGTLTKVGTLGDFAARVAARRQAFTDAQAARFLNQATLGTTDADIAAVRSLGYAAWLDQESARPLSASNWDWLVGQGIDKDPNARNSTLGADAAIWQRLLSAPDSLRQRVALAWSEIFVVGLDGLTGPFRQFQLAAWWDLLAQNAFGNFRSLLGAVTLNPAMGKYLNTAGNQKENTTTGRVPDENYAREVMQLFTIGLHELNDDGTPRLDAAGKPIESYTQDTVTQLARVFTGWNLDTRRDDTTPELTRRPMVLTASLHSTLAANFLGARVAAGTDGATALRIALDTLAAHHNVGPFIARQLIQRLVTSNPSPAYVARAAQAFNNNGQGERGDLKALLRAVLLDEEARSEANLGAPSHGKLREPMLRFVQWARSFKATSLAGSWNVGNTSDASTSLGQSPLRSPSVFNFFRPGYVPPNTALGSAGQLAPELQLTNESTVAGYLNTLQTATAAAHRDIRPDYGSELALATDAAALLDRIERLLSASQLSAATRSTILGALNSIASTTAAGRNARVYTAVFLVMASPEYLVQK